MPDRFGNIAISGSNLKSYYGYFYRGAPLLRSVYGIPVGSYVMIGSNSHTYSNDSTFAKHWNISRAMIASSTDSRGKQFQVIDKVHHDYDYEYLVYLLKEVGGHQYLITHDGHFQYKP